MRNYILFLFLALLLSACQKYDGGGYTGGDIRAKNHVAGQSVNWFSINGYRVPGLGGGYCCIMLPDKWFPGMQAKIEWEVNPKTASEFPGFIDRDKYHRWESELLSSYRKHTVIVDVPEYGKSRCGISVHFLPCNQVKVTTTCVGYGTPNYPIKEPMNMPEPKVCPK